jgi:hypothetical protein
MAIARIAALVLALTPAVLLAQKQTIAMLTVVVVDRANARIPRAGVQLLTSAGTLGPTVTADATGQAVIDVPPGYSALTVRAGGFKQLTRTDLQDLMKSSGPIHLTLDLANSSCTVCVTAQPTIPFEPAAAPSFIPVQSLIAFEPLPTKRIRRR